MYVDGFLTDEHGGADAHTLLFEVLASGPEPGPRPGLYSQKDLPGGWMRLVPDRELEWSEEEDRAVIQAAQEAGFVMMS